MGRRILGPRLGKADVEELLKAHMKAVQVDRMLKSTNWAAAPACALLVGEIDVLIARLYNKAERAMTRASEEPPAASTESPAAAEKEP